MELKDFVETSLQQICDGIKAAQEGVEGSMINPTNLTPSINAKVKCSRDMYQSKNGLAFLESVEFDVAITVTEGKETKGGIGVFAGAVGLGSQGKSDSVNNSMTRLKFSVPIIFPSDS